MRMKCHVKCLPVLGTGLALAVILLCGTAPRGWGQGVAYLTGYIKDQSGLGVPNVAITINNEATAATFSIRSNAAGLYRTPALEIGNYDVTVAATGFKTSITTGVTITVGQPRGMDITLQVGTQTQHIEVTAAAPALRTEDAGLSISIPRTTIAALPYFNRSAGSLINLVPGAQYMGDDALSYGASRYAIGSDSNTQVLIDGAQSTGDREDSGQQVINPTVEALQEMQVTQNIYSAQFGRDAGPLVQMETKSGSNAFHGGIYYYLRNEDLDTYNAFSNTRPVDREDMSGGTIGGAIKKNKLFFFESFENQKNTVPGSLVGTVPTAAEVNGDFSILDTPAFGNRIIYDPSTSVTNPLTGAVTRTPCTAGTPDCLGTNILNPTVFDPVAARLLKYIPAPSLPGIANNLPSTSGYQQTSWFNVSRIDFNASDKDRFSGVWMLNWRQDAPSGIPQYANSNFAAEPLSAAGGPGYRWKSQIFNIYDVHTFSSNFFMTNRFTYRPRYITRVSPAINPAAKWAETLGINNYPGAVSPPNFGGDLGFPTFNIAGYSSLGPGGLQNYEHPISVGSYDMDLTSVKGRHTYKWGLGIEHDEHGGASLSYPTGLFNFARTETGQGTSLVGGDAFASFQLGLTDNASGQAGPERLYDGWYLGGYFQDDWKPTSNLTFNIGIRYDLDGPIQEVHGYGSSFCFTCMNPVSGNPGTLEFFNSANPPYTTYYNTEWRRLAPRFGFAWKFLPKTVIRGGYGIFNTRPQFGFNAAGPTAGSMTSVSQSSIDNGVTPTFLLAHGFNVPYPIGGVGLNEGYGAVAPGQAPNTVVVFIERNWKLAYLQHFNLSIERELPGGMVLEVAGQGFLDRDVATGAHNYDEIPPAYWGVPGPLLNRHAFPQFAAVYDREAQAGTINAYSGYVKLERHFANGFSLQGSYSYGRSLGLQGGDIYSSFQGNNNLQKLFYGPTTYNSNGGTNFIPQVAGINAVYQFPAGFGRTYLNHGGAAGWILGNWEIGGIMNRWGGQPFGIGSGTDSLNCQCAEGGWANIVGNPNAVPGGKHPGEWFNPSAFAVPAFGQIGTFGSSTLMSPAGFKLDLSLRKEVKLTEKYRMQVVGEFFNFTNTPYYGIPDGNINPSDPTSGVTNTSPYGTLDPAAGSREVQLGLRIDF